LNGSLERLHLGLVTRYLDDLESALRHFERALSEFRAHGQTTGVAAALHKFGVVLTDNRRIHGCAGTLQSIVMRLP
jgi:hypothetical protein